MPLIDKNPPGTKYGRWTILNRDPSQKRPAKYWCECTCGNKKSIFLTNLRRGFSSQCQNCQALSRSKELIGKRFDHIVVLAIDKINNKASAKVKCDCGNERYLKPGSIKSGIYVSCGVCNLANKRRKLIFRLGKIGEKYGLLTIKHMIDGDKFLAICDCGNEIEVKKHHLLTQMPSCGCYWKKIHEERAKKLEGVTYFKLKVIKFIGMDENKKAKYLIKCKCGVSFEQSISYLFGSKSCGCLQKENAPKGSHQPAAKLTEVDVKAMRELASVDIYSKKQIAEMFGISYGGVINILKRKSWKHVL